MSGFSARVVNCFNGTGFALGKWAYQRPSTRNAYELSARAIARPLTYCFIGYRQGRTIKLLERMVRNGRITSIADYSSFKRKLERVIDSIGPENDHDTAIHDLMREGAEKGFLGISAKASAWIKDRMIAASGLEYLAASASKHGYSKALVRRLHSMAIRCSRQIMEDSRRILVKENIIMDMRTQDFEETEIRDLFRREKAHYLDKTLTREIGLKDDNEPFNKYGRAWKNMQNKG